jgi:regulator of sigma E protease
VITTVLSFAIVIGLLILIHELGHFIVARLAGVGVERFSIGFGPVLLRWRGRETEYCLSAVPMGGYVKMVGEENPLEGGGTGAWDPAKAFSMKPLWARFLIVFAGPGMNFVLAGVILIGLLMTVGRELTPAVLGRVTEGGPAAQAGLQTGDQVVAFGGRPVSNWEEDLAGGLSRADGRPVAVVVVRGDRTLTVTARPERTTVRDLFGDEQPVWDIGAGPLVTPQVSVVTSASPAERAGFKAGDVVVSVAGRRVFTPAELTNEIQRRPGQTFEVVVERGGSPLTLTVTASRERERGADGGDSEIGRIGIGIEPRMDVVTVRANPVTAVRLGVAQTWNMTALTLRGFWKLVTGQIHSSNIGGPLQIASEAGRQARQGVARLALFTAFISVNLAVLNLLPVPMLDGGHLFFFLIEAVMGRPLSLKKREAAQQVGFVLLMLLMGYALYNDLMRLDAFKLLR